MRSWVVASLSRATARSTISSTAPTGARYPVSPSTTTSGRPPWRVATTGTPHAIASSADSPNRSEEHTSELQSRSDLVCRLLLEKKKKTTQYDAEHALEAWHLMYNRSSLS